MMETQTKTRTIIEVANEKGNFKTFLSAIKTANLTERFSAKGSYTVLMPNDAAFAKLPAGDWDKYLRDEPRLAQILNYHVLAGNHPSSELANLTETPTMEGRSVKIVAQPELRFNDAKVVQRDMTAENGVIHVLDTVLLPR